MKVKKVSKSLYVAECTVGNVFVQASGVSMIEAIRFALIEIYSPFDRVIKFNA